MTKEEILKKAIEKANIDAEISGTGNINLFKQKRSWKAFKTLSPIEFIFSHDFAKAFWGEKDWGILKYEEIGNLKDSLSFLDNEPQWKTHLQLMVL